MFNPEKEVKKLRKHLTKIPDDKILEGYKEAMDEYEKSKNEQHKFAADIIKDEIDRRGLKVENDA